MNISVTHLRVRSFRFMPAFLWHTLKAIRQAEQSEGFIGGRLMREPGNIVLDGDSVVR